ncbi:MULTISPECIES: hypothetical protein [Comamonadaceae]|nr:MULTISPECIES: hypothetical protein [Comamonadaceae]ADV02165.1 hypothetical protein Alide_4563 [Alicycliphilus denitrificans BC]
MQAKAHKATGLTFEAILDVLADRTVLAANLSPAAPYPQRMLPDKPYRLELGQSSFYVHRGPTMRPLTFNEEQADTAKLSGDRLTMEDAQAFVLDLDLAPAGSCEQN